MERQRSRQMNKYNITMKTPLGIRYGTMTFVRKGSSVFGQIDILKCTEEYNGSVDSEGICHLKGCLTSPVRRIPFTAEGRIDEKIIDLIITEERNVFHMTGERNERRNNK